MIAATSATVRNLTSLSGVASAAIDSPLPTELIHHAGPGASVTPVSSVSPVLKRATPASPANSPPLRSIGIDSPIFAHRCRSAAESRARQQNLTGHFGDIAASQTQDSRWP